MPKRAAAAVKASQENQENLVNLANPKVIIISNIQNYSKCNLLFFYSDICGLNLEATVCPNGYVKSVFVSPPSDTDAAIECPVYPFAIYRKFDCIENGVRFLFCVFFNMILFSLQSYRPEPPANARVCYYCKNRNGPGSNDDDFTLIRSCDSISCNNNAISCNCVDVTTRG